MARKRYSDEHQSRAITSTHLHQNNAFEPCFLTPFAKIYWHSSRGLRQMRLGVDDYDLYPPQIERDRLFFKPVNNSDWCLNQT